jgi:hypothetical protein
MAQSSQVPKTCLAYSELPRRSYVLDSCWRMESKTRQFPFVVASDLETSHNDPPQQVVTNHRSIVDDDSLVDESIRANREFLIFHDVDHYLTLKHCFPHCHEIIRTPSSVGEKEQSKSKSGADDDFKSKSYRDDLAKGRLIFDFDLTEPLPEMASYINLARVANPNQPINPLNFVPANFKHLIETLIIEVFQRYYIQVDTSKLVFGWQFSYRADKFSMHLIVKHAYFAEFWVKQMRIFYALMSRVAELKGCPSLMKAVDFQIPRRNATFRLIGCSKVGGQPLQLDSINVSNPSIYDCFVGIYHPEHLKSEQSINLENLNYVQIQDELNTIQETTFSHHELPEISNKKSKASHSFTTVIKRELDFAETAPEIDLDDHSVEKAVELFETFNDGTWTIRDHVGNIINLNRRRASPCPLSGIVHEHENAYLKLYPDGRVGFLCRRGCCHPTTKAWSVTLGYYRAVKKQRMVSPQNSSQRQGTVASQNFVTNESSMVPAVVEKPRSTGREITMRINLDKFKDIMTAKTKVTTMQDEESKREALKLKNKRGTAINRTEKPMNSARSIIMLPNTNVHIQAF